MKVALYCRVSTTEQTNENQKQRLIEYATQHGHTYDIYEETESSRKTRPVKQALLAKLRNNEYAAVIVYKLDRWARSSTELILETKELLDKNVSFIALADNLDFTTASGKLHFQILSAFAEFERELIRERTLEGLRRAKAQNKQIGRPKGKKDTKKRAVSGYILRQANERKKQDEEKGVYKNVTDYIEASQSKKPTKKPSPKK